MSWIKSILGNKADNEAEEKLPWKLLTADVQVENMLKESETIPVAVFKHSPRCGISSMVLRSFERNFAYKPDEVSLFMVDVVAYREISLGLARNFEVQHESPQLLVIKNRKVILHQSHHEINAEFLG
ncbi:bacillithiol system protein YtxJ [Mesonia hippocampi]|uniref:Bacillithiol system protein YtxJ n=1 Tax=Mesonia hippocampi TaxID=1628250 RepID=A0A840EYI1_9FLAO|nr:bacillithiol system redox-active protein YtxJ [Mesonia hippocampi]MBB4119104.1 bacillithiol system protein YtxJ [Mesonia hippocampi]